MRWGLSLLCILVLSTSTGCGDDDANSGGERDTDAMVPIEDTDSAMPDPPDVPPMPMDPVDPPMEVGDGAARIEVTLEPRRALYEVGAEIVATAVAVDRFGERVDGAEFSWSVAPPGVAEVDAAGRLTTVGEGPGALSACIDDLCGVAPFFVDAGPPTLTVEGPARGAMLGGDAVGGIEVTGRAADSAGQVEVRVNGERAELGEDGAFSLVVPARFGVNQIKIVADDGVRRPAVEDVRYVLWAPRYQAVNEDSAAVEGAIVARVDQAILDGDQAAMVPEEGGDVTLGDMAELLRLFIQLADIRGLLGDPVLVDQENMRLRFDALELNTPEVELSFVSGGLELFLRLPDISVVTGGFMSLEGQDVSLNGAIRASLAAFARFGLTADGGLAVTVESTGIALETIEGDFESDAVRALVNSFASILGDTVQNGLFSLVDGLMREQVPTLIQSALGALESAISRVPLELDSGIGAPISLALEVSPRSADVRRRTAMSMIFDAVVTGEGIEPREGDRGIARVSDPTPSDNWGDGIGASLRLETLNALLHEVWRTGAMTLSPVIPERYQVLLDDIAIDARLPPIIVPAPVSSELPLVLQMGSLQISTTPSGTESSDDYVIALEVGVGIDAQGTSLTLQVAESPVVSATLLEASSGNPLPSDIFVGILDTVVWPLVQGVVSESTALAFGEVALPAEALSAYTPRLQAVSVLPVFSDAREVVDGRLSLEGAVEIRVSVGAP